MSSLQPARPRLAAAIAFARHVQNRFVADRCLAAAASLSYTSLLALVPLAAIGFAVLSAFPAFQSMQQDLQAFIFENFVPSAVDTAQTYVVTFIENARGLKAVGIVGLAVTALLLFTTIETALNVIFRVDRTRSLLHRLLVFWAMLTLGPLLMGASFSIATAFSADASAFTALSGLVDLATQALPTVLSIAAFAFLYLIMPNRPVRVSHALVGAVVAGIGFTLLRWAFTIYVTRFPSYQNLYGTLATLPIFLFWMYLSWAVVLAGAVITAALPDWGRPLAGTADTLGPGRRLRLALAVLGALYARARVGGGLAEAELIDGVDAATADVATTAAALQAAGFIDRTEDGAWVAVRDPAAVTLFELVRTLRLDLHDMTDPAPPWPDPRLAALIAADAGRQREALSISLRELLAAPAKAVPPEPAAPASALRFHRTP